MRRNEPQRANTEPVTEANGCERASCLARITTCHRIHMQSINRTFSKNIVWRETDIYAWDS